MTPVSSKYLGKAIRQLRRDREMSQDALAVKIGSHGPNLVKIEKGRQIPGSRMVERIAKALELPDPAQIYRLASDLARHSSKGESPSEGVSYDSSRPDLADLTSELTDIIHRLFAVVRKLGPQAPLSVDRPDHSPTPAKTAPDSRRPKRPGGR